MSLSIEAPTPPIQSTGAWGHVLRGIDKNLGTTVEWLAALLVLVETCVLLTGVFFRFVLHKPLIWSDELASILFVWLAMLGAVCALRRVEHMRMSAVVNRMTLEKRTLFDALGLVACLGFLVMAVAPAIEYAHHELIVTTPALGISNAWRAAALPVGVVLMIVFAMIRLVTQVSGKNQLISFAVVGAFAAVLWAISPVYELIGNYSLLVFFVGVTAICVFSAVPIGFAFGIATFGYLALVADTPLPVAVGRMDEGMSHLILLAVPLFVFLGLLVELTGMAKAMVAFLGSMLGHVKGGLSYVLIGAMYLVSGISGSKAADMAAIAPALFPEMKERGYKEGDLIALLSATGAQTETVPPSLVLITIGSVTGVSIAALFLGGLLPAVFLGFILGIVVWRRSRNVDISAVKKASKKDIAKLFVIAIPALALPFIIRFAVVEGVATATEVSTIGILYAVIVGILVYRQFPLKRLLPALVNTASLSGAILFIIGTATAMAWGLTQSGFSDSLAAMMEGLPGGKITFMLASIIAFAVLGAVLEGIPAIVLFAPLLFPIATNLGIHEVHYAMVAILSMGLGLFSPPLGVGYYTACAIARVSPDEGIRPIIGYMFALFLGILVIAFVPWISIGFL